MEEFSVVIMKRFRSNWFEKTKGGHVTYNTRQSVVRRNRIYASFVKSKILTSATFLIEKRSQKKFHHISKINLFPLSPIATLAALAVKFSTTKKHCKIVT
jgi:hypothetical protein